MYFNEKRTDLKIRSISLLIYLLRFTYRHATTEKVTKSDSLSPLGKNSLLSKIGDQRCDRKCYQ